LPFPSKAQAVGQSPLAIYRPIPLKSLACMSTSKQKSCASDRSTLLRPRSSVLRTRTPHLICATNRGPIHSSHESSMTIDQYRMTNDRCMPKSSLHPRVQRQSVTKDDSPITHHDSPLTIGDVIASLHTPRPGCIARNDCNNCNDVNPGHQ